MAFIYTERMVRLHRKIEYALMALKLLAAQPTSSPSHVIAKKLGAPGEAIAKILQSLAKKKMIESTQGIAGGYRLTRRLNEISFLELYELFSGPIKIVKCLDQNPSACETYRSCNIISPMQAFNYKIRDFYSELSLDQLLHFSQKGSQEGSQRGSQQGPQKRSPRSLVERISKSSALSERLKL